MNIIQDFSWKQASLLVNSVSEVLQANCSVLSGSKEVVQVKIAIVQTSFAECFSCDRFHEWIILLPGGGEYLLGTQKKLKQENIFVL